MNTKKIALAWCAGFFDGEGTIYQLGNTPYVYLWQCTREALDIFKEIVGFGIVYEKNKANAYCYYVGGNNGATVIKLLLPYLIVKKNKAIQALELRKKMKHKGWNWQKNSTNI